MSIFCVNVFHMLSYISLLEKDELDISLTVIQLYTYRDTCWNRRRVRAHGPTPLLEWGVDLSVDNRTAGSQKMSWEGSHYPKDLIGSRSGLQPHWIENGFWQNIQEWNHTLQWPKRKNSCFLSLLEGKDVCCSSCWMAAILWSQRKPVRRQTKRDR